MRLKKFLLLFLIFFSTPALAVTRYVGQGAGDSDSNTCTQALTDSDGNRKATINGAAACYSLSVGGAPNDIIEARVGTYTSFVGPDLPKGSSWSAPFTVRCRTGEVCTLRTTGTDGVMRLYNGANNNWYTIIQGFKFDGVNLTGQQVTNFGSCCDGPRAVRLIGNEITGLQGNNAIYVNQFSQDIQVIGNEIHGGTRSGGTGYAMYWTGQNGLAENNHIYDLDSWAIHQYSEHSPPPDNNIFRFNKIHDFALINSNGTGILLGTGTGSSAYHNIIYNAAGTGIHTGGCGLCASTGSKVYNNTVYKMTQLGIATDTSTNAVVRNNIIFSNGTNTNFTGTGTTADHNITTDPLFVSAP
jgi:parallel beta-helix repeat protein